VREWARDRSRSDRSAGSAGSAGPAGHWAARAEAAAVEVVPGGCRAPARTFLPAPCRASRWGSPAREASCRDRRLRLRAVCRRDPCPGLARNLRRSTRFRAPTRQLEETLKRCYGTSCDRPPCAQVGWDPTSIAEPLGSTPKVGSARSTIAARRSANRRRLDLHDLLIQVAALHPKLEAGVARLYGFYGDVPDRAPSDRNLLQRGDLDVLPFARDLRRPASFDEAQVRRQFAHEREVGDGSGAFVDDLDGVDRLTPDAQRILAVDRLELESRNALDLRRQRALDLLDTE